jgi:peptide/nickel transport system substrate-binding protein
MFEALNTMGIRVRLLGIFLLLGLFGCVKRRNLSDNTLIVHLLADPKGLHPTNNNDGYQRMVFQCTQKRLITLNLETSKPEADLLETMPILLPDSLSYLCTLREGIFWDDGSVVDAEDVEFTLKAIVCKGVSNPEQKSLFNNFQSIELDPTNPLSFVLRMKERFFDNTNLMMNLVLLQPEFHDSKGLLKPYSVQNLMDPGDDSFVALAMETFSAEFNKAEYGRDPKHLNGLGPYKLVDWQTGASITLEKKQNWWGRKSLRISEKAFPDKIIFRVIRDMEATILAIKREEIDISTELSAAAMARLQQKQHFNENFHSEYVGSFSYTYMGMNMRPETGRTPFFTDRRVRRAMAHLVPVDEIIAVLAKGKANRLAGFIQPGQPDYNPNLPFIEKDLSKAIALLEDAGWKDSDGNNVRDKIIDGKRVQFSFSLSYMISPVTTELAKMIQHEFYKAGLDARTEPMEFSVFYQQAFAHQFDAMLGSWSTSALPEDPRQLWHSDSWEENGSNFVGFGTAYSDSLIERANRELAPSRRTELIRELEKIVWEEQPYVFLFNATRKAVVHRRFDNIELHTEKPHIYLNNLRLKPGYQ